MLHVEQSAVHHPDGFLHQLRVLQKRLAGVGGGGGEEDRHDARRERAVQHVGVEGERPEDDRDGVV